MENNEKITFSDLSIWLKIPVIVGWGMIVVYALIFIISFIIGLIEGIVGL